jgi:hypothetical protein
MSLSWITTHRPTEFDADADGDVEVRLSPEDDSSEDTDFRPWHAVPGGAPWRRTSIWGTQAFTQP